MHKRLHRCSLSEPIFGLYYVDRLRFFQCCFDYDKKSLYKSFNAIFSNNGCFLSADVVVYLLKSKIFLHCLHFFALLVDFYFIQYYRIDISSFDQASLFHIIIISLSFTLVLFMQIFLYYLTCKCLCVRSY